jgi:hypothetical protein
MRNPRSRAGAPDLDATVDGDVPTLDAVKRFFADFKRLKAHVDGVGLREDVAQFSMSVMTAYLAGELPAEEAASLEEFIRAQPLLRETYAGLVAAWQAPNAERTVTAEEVDAGYARFRARVAAKSEPSEQ